MNISLTPELEKVVAEKVKSGLYQTSSEVIREGLRLLIERDTHLNDLRRDVRAGLDAIERGEFVDYDDSTVLELSKRVATVSRQRLAAGSRKTGAR